MLGKVLKVQCKQRVSGLSKYCCFRNYYNLPNLSSMKLILPSISCAIYVSFSGSCHAHFVFRYLSRLEHMLAIPTLLFRCMPPLSVLFLFSFSLFFQFCCYSFCLKAFIQRHVLWFFKYFQPDYLGYVKLCFSLACFIAFSLTAWSLFHLKDIGMVVLREPNMYS